MLKGISMYENLFYQRCTWHEGSGYLIEVSQYVTFSLAQVSLPRRDIKISVLDNVIYSF